MRPQDWARLAGLALIWSLQYIFMRIAVPVIGMAPVAEARALFGALVLVAAAWIVRERISPLERWRDYLIVSLTNNALPFLCLSWAAVTLPASYLSIINGTLTLWAALFAAYSSAPCRDPRRTSASMAAAPRSRAAARRWCPSTTSRRSGVRAGRS